jgi:hypothetical protein
MRNSLLHLALPALVLASLTAVPAGAHTLSCGGDRVHFAERRDPAGARLAITTEDGKVCLLLTDREVALQLSDRMLRRVDRKLRKHEEERDNVIGNAIATVVIGTVRELIDNSFTCRLRDLRDVSYEDGRLRMVDRDGQLVFGDAEIGDTDVMCAFSDRDARAFVREFRRWKNGD